MPRFCRDLIRLSRPASYSPALLVIGVALAAQAAHPTTVRAQATSAPATEAPATPASVVGVRPAVAMIGDPITITVVGKAPSQKRFSDLRLFLNGRPVGQAGPAVVTPRPGGQHDLVFDLVYDDSSAAYRAGWKHAFGLSGRKNVASVAWDGEPVLAGPTTGVANADQFELRISGDRVALFLPVFVLLVIVFAALAWKTNLLRNQQSGAGAGGPVTYAVSLGRCQMALWLFVTMASILFIWLVSGRFTVTEQVLILIGVSVSSALGSVTIDAAKQTNAAGEAAQATQEAAKANAAAVAANARALAVVPADVSAAAAAAEFAAMATERTARATAKSLQAVPPTPRGFFQDILSDKDGISFHRFQLAAWTVVLALYFIVEVATTFQMPVFSTTVLALMGISHSTYVGFKFPERRT